jgi:hypothetical protein
MNTVVRGAAKGGGRAARLLPPNSKLKKKNTEFVEIVLCDLPFSRNKSATEIA